MYQGVMNDFKLHWFDDCAASREAGLLPADRRFSIEIGQRQRP
jgi:hypothetical protein